MLHIVVDAAHAAVREARAPDEAIQKHKQKIRGLVADELHHIRVAQEQVINVVVILVTVGTDRS